MGQADVSGVAADVLRSLSDLGDVDQASAVADWRATGLTASDGRTFPVGSTAHGRPATVARRASRALAEVARARFGVDLDVDGARLLGQRARLPGVLRSTAAPRLSRGGSARLLRAADQWWTLNLARPSDLDLLPALIESEVTDPWPVVEDWASRIPAEAIVERATMLGMAAARLGETPAPLAPWRTTERPATNPGGSRRVVNLGSLWAGPLAAHLLGRLGMDVVHVESVHRPDASRWGSPDFYDHLRAGGEVRTIDFTGVPGRAELQRLVTGADIVIEASRPRALEALGVAPREVMADGRGRTWLQITGHGAGQPLRVGFGDDAAVAGGLVVIGADGAPGFYGDAVADPLTGLLGALAVAASHAPDRATLIEVSLARSAAFGLRAGTIAG